MVLQNCTKRTADIRRKEVVGEFKNIGFDIEIDANLKMVNSLDITLDLYSDSYKPYKKPNDRLQYVHIFQPSSEHFQTTTAINNKQPTIKELVKRSHLRTSESQIRRSSPI